MNVPIFRAKLVRTLRLLGFGQVAMLAFERQKIGEILVDLGVLRPEQIDDVLLAIRQRCDRAKFGRVGREMGLLQEEHILAALAVQMKMFPGIQSLTLSKLLRKLRQPV